MTPEQIETATFSTLKRGGYREEEVDRFLRAVADQMRSLTSQPPAPQPEAQATQAAQQDLDAASLQMADLMREVHASLGEKRRLAEAEIAEMRAAAEREASSVVAAAAEQAEGVRQQADKVLSDAEGHAELLRSDAEQRVREQCQETLRGARSELQELLRVKHEILFALDRAKTDLGAVEVMLEQSALAPDVLDDAVVDQTLIDLRPAPPPPVVIEETPAGNSGAIHPSLGGGADPGVFDD